MILNTLFHLTFDQTGLAVLWLQGNGIKVIENLNCQKNLRTLYLQENGISKIENLNDCFKLDTIDLSKNRIYTIENLSHLHNLTTLILSNNELSSAKSIAHVKALPNLNLLDLANNKLDEGESNEIVEIFASCPQLKVLHFTENKIIDKIEYYRRKITCSCKKLVYLDDYPITKDDRRCFEVWWNEFAKNGSIEDASNAERKERKVMKDERDADDEENYFFLADLMNDHELLSEEKEAKDEEDYLFLTELENHHEVSIEQKEENGDEIHSW